MHPLQTHCIVSLATLRGLWCCYTKVFRSVEVLSCSSRLCKLLQLGLFQSGPHPHTRSMMSLAPPTIASSPLLLSDEDTLNQITLPTLGSETSAFAPVGVVERVVGVVIETTGPHAKLGDVCRIALPGQRHLQAEVVGFRDGKLLLMPLGECTDLSPGCRVWNTGKPLMVGVGPALKGRVLDALGNPLDGRFPVAAEAYYPVVTQPPHPLTRTPIRTIIPVGIRAIDGLLTMGRGQRVGVFAGSGVGKSTTLGMMARNTQADINVIALIGERGREVQEFLDEALGKEGMQRSIVVVATAEQPALLKIRAGLLATAIAEYFRDEGKQVLLMMDSVTRIAMALREVGLAIGEPPTTRGYTPSVFAFMPKLLERAGTSTVGSITGIYTVLVEGDDMNEPVADLVRGLLDGHIVLSRQLAHRGHFPAIDINASISRLFNTLATPTHKAQAFALREALAVYTQNEDLLSIGAYVPGSNPGLDRAVGLKPLVDQFLKQAVDEPVSLDEMFVQLAQVSGVATG
jgi:flagellum-specific ATP synthase